MANRRRPFAGPQTISAPNFGLFDAATGLTIPSYGGSANQHQRSQLLPSAITVISDADCFRPAMVGTGFSNTRSLTDVTFSVAGVTDVTLSASGTAFTAVIPIHQIRLIGPSGTVVN